MAKSSLGKKRKKEVIALGVSHALVLCCEAQMKPVRLRFISRSPIEAATETEVFQLELPEPYRGQGSVIAVDFFSFQSNPVVFARNPRTPRRRRSQLKNRPPPYHRHQGRQRPLCDPQLYLYRLHPKYSPSELIKIKNLILLSNRWTFPRRLPNLVVL